MLDERKKRVLQAVIESYIETGEPVGSRTVSKMQELNFSPATIRNEMADLEDMGYLEQPHVSAGRIPSDLGYRYYIENIMNKPALPQDEMRDLQRLINEKAAQVKELIREIAELYTRLIKYTVFALPVEMSEDIVLRGMANFLNFPEYSNVQKAREIMQFLDNTENIRKAVVPSRSIEKPRIEIIIGKENHASEMKDCSMIVSRFKTGGEGYGTIGVIGPTRMDYSKAVSTLEFLTKQLEEMGYDL